MFRTLLERMARERVFLRRLPPHFSRRPIYLSPDAALSFLRPNCWNAANSLLSAAQKYVRPNDCVWDIGSNVGVFSLAAAHQVGAQGRILAVEPDTFLANLLRKTSSLQKNKDRLISVLCMAVSDSCGFDELLIARRGRSSNALQRVGQRSQADGIRRTLTVGTTTLDTLLTYFPAPNLIKIDVEGAEALTLKGASKVLSEVRPLLYVEVGQAQSAEVQQLLKTYDYKMYNGDTEDEVVLEACTYNTLAVPTESKASNRGVAPAT